MELKIDPLTGLPNDRYFLKLAGEEMQKAYLSGKKTVVVTFDFVGMKGFNTRYGREEGDRLLIAFASLLKRYFEAEHCSRFGEDHFYCYTEFERVDGILNEIMVEMNGLNSGKTLPVKMGICNYMEGTPVGNLCDLAKMAADSRKATYGSSYAWLDEKMLEEYNRREYILSHLDQALAEGWIHVYYQPVIRALTGQLCSSEALVRWIDPRYGFISPGEFIPLLEEYSLSYKIDQYVVNCVVENIQRVLRSGRKVAPVSVNISRTDFDVVDPVEMVAKAADDYGIPRRLLYIEITETAINNDNGTLRHAVDRFHKAGFQVWMDDFGSGYSSLNVLKDYSFDEIKIDMIFLKNFDERAKKIVTSVVKMAKILGIHTLVEGVETKAHVEFLRSIGCEKIQGYYFGKPMPFEEGIANLAERGIKVESRENCSFYDTVGEVDLVTGRSRALILFRNDRFIPQFINDRFKEEIRDWGRNAWDVIDWNMNNAESVLAKRFREMAGIAATSGKKATMTFAVNDKYFNFSMRCIADTRQSKMYLCEVHGRMAEEQKLQSILDSASRSILLTYDCIYELDLDSDSRRIITSDQPNEESGASFFGVKDFCDNYIARRVHFEDVDRFRLFTDFESAKEKLKRSSRGYISDIFRVKEESGDYEWKQVSLIAVPNSYNLRFLMCIAPVEISEDEISNLRKMIYNSSMHHGENPLFAEDLLKAMGDKGSIKFFWKDKERRFQGVSDAFLKYYGFHSLEDIRGKTDEEMGWHLKDIPFRDDEMDILEHGKIIRSAPGENVVDNVVHNILANKFPVYHDGKISGLMGYFLDVEQDMNTDSPIGRAVLTDNDTGLMDAHGLFIATLKMDDNYRINKEDYTFISLKVPEFTEIIRNYGAETGKELIRRVGKKIHEFFDDRAAAGRISGCSFGIVLRGLPDRKLSESLALCADKIAAIGEIEGKPLHIHLDYGISYGSEESNAFAVVERSYQRLDKNLPPGAGNRKPFEKGELDPYNELPLPFVICRPYLEDGKFQDMIFVYANRKYCEVTGVTPDDLVGKRYLELFPDTSRKWVEYAQRAGKGEFIHEQAYCGALGGIVDFIGTPASVPGYHTFLFNFVMAGKEQKNDDEKYLKTSEAVMSILTKAENIVEFDDTMEYLMEEVGCVTGADRCLMIKTDHKTLSVVHEWVEDGAKPAKDERHRLSDQYLKPWKRILSTREYIRYDDVKNVKQTDPMIYDYLRAMDIYNFISYPLYLDGVRMGYLSIDNFDPASEIDVQLVVEKLADFISAKIKKQEAYDIKVQSKKEESWRPYPVMSDAGSVEELSKRLTTILDSKDQYENRIARCLDVLTEEIHPDRIWIVERDGDMAHNTFEWCADGISSEKETLQNLDFDKYYGTWEKLVKESSVVVIDALEGYRESDASMYLTLKRQGICNLIALPFYDHGSIMGYLGVDNYKISEYHRTIQVLETASFLIGAKISSHYFKKINSYDALTGVHNRNAMLMRKRSLRGMSGSIGIIFADLNGLKEVNDVNGHEAGDQFIRSAANVLMGIYEKEYIYRSGGDEFVIIIPGISKEEFEKKRGKLQKILNDPLAPKMAAGFAWSESMEGIDESIREADRQMYDDKSEFYREHIRYRK